jgi:hypothetical protein
MPPSTEAGKGGAPAGGGLDPALAPRFHWANLLPREVALRLESA